MPILKSEARIAAQAQADKCGALGSVHILPLLCTITTLLLWLAALAGWLFLVNEVIERLIENRPSGNGSPLVFAALALGAQTAAIMVQMLRRLVPPDRLR